ncbi:MAG: hypothetical protein AAGC58_02325 [Asticcacaulis sp.]
MTRHDPTASHKLSIQIAKQIADATKLDMPETCIVIETVCTILCLTLRNADKRTAAILMDAISERVAGRIAASEPPKRSNFRR